MAQSISQESISVTGQIGAQAASRYAGATVSGAPTTGNFLLGDHVIDQTGNMWFCVAAGNPGSWIATTSLSYDQLITSYNPTAWWKLNDAVGSPAASDSSGGRFGTTASGTVTFGATGPIIGSQTNTAVTFTATTSGQLTTSTPVSLNLNTQSFTFSAWIKPTSYPSSGTAQIIGYFPNIGITLETNGAMKLWFNGIGTPTGSVSTNVWHHVVGTYTAGTNARTLYLDGVLVGTDSGGTITDLSSVISIGGAIYWSGYATYFNGSIAEASILPVTLTAAQVLQLYNSATRTQLTPAQQGALPITENVAGKNFIINGGMDIWQRGTSFALTNTVPYTADRWCVQPGANSVWTASQVASGLTGFKYAQRFQRTSGSTSTANLNIGSTIETLNSLPLAGQTVILSFWARAGANLINTPGSIISYGTGTDQNLVTTAFTAVSSSYSNTYTTSWQRFSQTVAIPSNATQVGVQFYTNGESGTAGANDYFDITGVQLEIGSTATAFSRAGGNYWAEYQLCLAYYEQYNSEFVGRIDQIDVANRPEFIVTYYNKRVNPTITVTNASNIVWNSLTSTSGANTTSFGGAYIGTQQHSTDLFFNTTSGITAYGLYAPVTSAGTYSINISAEL